jgi:hypothetical protein
MITYIVTLCFLLNNLNLKGLEIKENFNNKEIENTNIDFSNYKIKSFKNIDSLKFQQKLRDEWS